MILLGFSEYSDNDYNQTLYKSEQLATCRERNGFLRCEDEYKLFISFFSINKFLEETFSETFIDFFCVEALIKEKVFRDLIRSELFEDYILRLFGLRDKNKKEKQRNNKQKLLRFAGRIIYIRPFHEKR